MHQVRQPKFPLQQGILLLRPELTGSKAGVIKSQPQAAARMGEMMPFLCRSQPWIDAHKKDAKSGPNNVGNERLNHPIDAGFERPPYCKSAPAGRSVFFDARRRRLGGLPRRGEGVCRKASSRP